VPAPLTSLQNNKTRDIVSYMPKPTSLLRLLSPEFIFVLIVLLCMTLYAHSATSSTQHKNSLGFVQYTSNPYMYLEGAVVCRTDDECTVRRRGEAGAIVTELTFNPSHTYGMYIEKISFCGNRADDFQDMTGTIVVSYLRVAHAMPGGVACHDLASVHKVEAIKAPWQRQK
jgi:hypothetical protein